MGQLRKTEAWWARQRFILKNQGYYQVPRILFPWEAFPPLPTQATVWDMAFVEQWLTDIWLPFWQALPCSEQDDLLARQNVPDESWLQLLAKYEVPQLSQS